MDPSKIAQNTTYLTIASIFQKALSFVYFAFLAKILGSESLGQYQAVLSFCGIFIIFMDFGLGPVLTREAAKNEKNLQKLFSQYIGLKLILIFLSLVAMIGTANILHYLKPISYTHQDLLLIYIGGIIIILDTLIFTFFCVFRAIKNLRYEAFNVIIYQGIIFCAGLFGLIYTQSVFFLLAVLICGSLFSIIYFSILIKKRTNIVFSGIYNLKLFINILKLSIPFAIAGIFVKLNGAIDMQMLKYMLVNGNHYVGLYTLAFKLTFALTVLSGAFASAFFPSMSYYLLHDVNKAKKIFEQGFNYMSLLSLPISVGVLLLADKLILTVWDYRYYDSILPLKIYIASLLFIFLNYPIGNFLNAANKQVVNTLNTGLVLLVNIVLNYFLIPKYNIVGAAIAAFISNVILVALGLPWVYKIIKFNFTSILVKFLKIFFASMVMGLIIFLAKKYLIISNAKILLLLYMAIGSISYFLILLIIRGITMSELKAFWSSIKQ